MIKQLLDEKEYKRFVQWADKNIVIDGTYTDAYIKQRKKGTLEDWDL